MYFLGVKKTSTAGATALPFNKISWKKKKCSLLELVPPRGENKFEATPTNIDLGKRTS